jgi:solute:Na+ symporter, SSS family
LNGLGVILGITFAYIAAATAIGVFAARKARDTHGFMTGSGQMGPVLIGILMMSEFIGTGTTLGTAQLAYSKGISVVWNVVTLGLGFILYSRIMAPKFNALGEYTVSGALQRKYGNAVKSVVSVIMIYALVAVNVSMYTGGAATIASLLGIPVPAAVAIIALAAIVNVSAGGIRSVGYSNILHAGVKYLGLIVTAAVAYTLTGPGNGTGAAIPASHMHWTGVGYTTLAAWTLANVGAVFSTQYVIQCISSLRTPRDATRASLVAGIAIIPIGFLAAFVGICARTLFPGIASVTALPAFVQVMNPWMGGIVVSGIVASTFVTILACQLGATALFIKDFYVPLAKPAEKHMIFAARLTAVVAGLLPVPFALFVPGLLKTLFFARALRSTIAVIAVFMFYFPKTGGPKSAFTGLAGGAIGATVWFALGDPLGIDNIYVAAAIPLLAMILPRSVLAIRETVRNGIRTVRTEA